MSRAEDVSWKKSQDQRVAGARNDSNVRPARESAKSMVLVYAMDAVKGAAHGAPPLPTEDAYFTQGD